MFARSDTRLGLRHLGVVLYATALVTSACTNDDDAAPDERTSTTTEATDSTTTTVPSPSSTEAPEPGGLESAAVAVREACRRFYGYDAAENQSGTVPISPEALAARCDQPAIEWRSDCYDTQVPDDFEPRVGGCAYLGGHLAVHYGDAAGDSGAVFEGADGDRWWIVPESD